MHSTPLLLLPATNLSLVSSSLARRVSLSSSPKLTSLLFFLSQWQTQLNSAGANEDGGAHAVNGKAEE